MLHADAALTPRQRLRMAQLVVEEDWPKSRAGEFFGVAWKPVTTSDCPHTTNRAEHVFTDFS